MTLNEPSFILFPDLPVEIRLKIWRQACQPRVVEVHLRLPPKGHPNRSEIRLDVRPFLRPSSPIIYNICQESRNEALCLYRPCAGHTWTSPEPFPFNLWCPALDDLYLPISLYALQGNLPQNMFSAEAALSMGTPREFILDRLAFHPADVAAIRSLAISWRDMHIRDVPTLLKALKPFTALRELSLTLFDMYRPIEENRNLDRGKLKAILVDSEVGPMRNRHLRRVCGGYMELADTLNEGFSEVVAQRSTELGGRRGKLPTVTIKRVRYEL